MMRRFKTPRARALALSWIMGSALFLAVARVDAQSLRDPTVPPGEAGLAGTTPSGKALRIEPGSMTIVVRGGRPYLAVGTRLYAQGQNLGHARIERISETEVWLREAGVLRKVPQFPGIQRHIVTPVVLKPGCATSGLLGTKSAAPVKVSKTTSTSKVLLPVAPCADVQP